MKRVLIILSISILIALCGLVIFLVIRPSDDGGNVSRIGIGGGGAFLNPMIDPTDEDTLYVTSDMGGIYYSHNKGKTWGRTDTRGVFTQTHIADTGVVFCGGYGVYSSNDKGKTLNLIYPKDVKHSVSRCGWNENLMLAECYDNGYVKCIATNSSYVFFVTIDWQGSLRFIQCDYSGDNLEILHTMQTVFTDPMSDVDVHMLVDSDGVYLGIADKIYFYDFATKNFAVIYTTSGCIKDVNKIENNIYFIDDRDDRSLILYTNDFVSFDDLMDYNTLTNEFTKYGRDGTFNWHFKEIDGNNFNNIYLSFSSPVNEYDDVVDGVMKFNGHSFEWVFDSMYKTRHVTELNGWSYGAHGPIYGICASPHNDNIFLVANVETVYMMEYPNEEGKKITALHCNDYGDGRYSTNGLDVQTTYFVKEDPFDKNHIIICTTDLGLQNSYDNGETWQRMDITGSDYDIYNTCYDLYFDKYQKDVVYGLWSSRHDAPYNPTIYDKDYTKGAFAISLDGGKTWDFSYSSGIPSDAIPVRMSISHSVDEFTIAVATFNRGFYISKNGGKDFISINNGMDTVEGLVYGEDIVLTEDIIYCLTAPYLENGYWMPSRLYQYNLGNMGLVEIDLGDIVLARSLAYSEDKGLFINVIPTYTYKWFEEYNDGSWVNENGGIYHYTGDKIEKFFENNDGVFYSTFSSDGKMYATDTYGKVFVIDDDGSKLLYSGLFNMLKNISFSLDGKTMYI
ncbi:MAG: hypothetical protein E7361_00635, partial [Clostridiales bacterium]|nr:hypothetical protein [Clostridiales bacterium]